MGENEMSTNVDDELLRKAQKYERMLERQAAASRKRYQKLKGEGLKSLTVMVPEDVRVAITEFVKKIKDGKPAGIVYQGQNDKWVVSRAWNEPKK